MDWYYYIAWMIIFSQIPYLVLAIKNYRYALAKHGRRRGHYKPPVVLFVPCKGVDHDFQNNISSLFNQDYGDYLLWFIVEDTKDAAYAELCKLKEKLGPRSKARDVQILVAGKGEYCGQKIHNLLYAYNRTPADVEVLAFVDSDARVRTSWLKHLVHPLRTDKNAVTSGYRWFVPKANNLATLALSAINGKVAQLLGNTRCNQAWGGSMAIKVETFRELGIDNIWPKALSDDLTLSRAAKKVRKKVEFVPGCLVASYEQTTWPELFEFCRRQFIITRVVAPGTWWFGLLSTLYSLLGFWVTAALAVYAATLGEKNLALYVAVPVVFFAGQLTRAILRQAMIREVLKEDWPKLKLAAAADIFLFWIWSPLLLLLILSSAFGRTIRWRGVEYRLISPTETIVLVR